MKVVIYARESSKDETKAPPIQRQIERGKEFCKNENHELIKIFGDKGYSGGDWKRPDLNRMLRFARGHRFSVLWVWDQDRLARDTEQFLWLYRQLRDSHVKVFSGTDGWVDMETLGGRVKHTTLAMSHEIFRIHTSEKVKKAYSSKKQKAQEKGEKLDWGRKPKLTQEERERILELKRKHKDWGYRRIAQEIGDHVSYQTVRRVMKS